jgi:ribonuclease PH
MNFIYNLNYYRPIKIEFIKNSKSEVYATKILQGNTSVIVYNRPIKEGYNRDLNLEYNVSNLADKLEHQGYRKSRRHYEILDFLEKSTKHITLYEKKCVFVYNTDGSSRTTAVNAIGVDLLSKNYIKIPIAISFGLYENKLVYDLNYIEDSKGSGDCALAFIVSNFEHYLCAMLYEGELTIDQFIEGYKNSIKATHNFYDNLSTINKERQKL